MAKARRTVGRWLVSLSLPDEAGLCGRKFCVLCEAEPSLAWTRGQQVMEQAASNEHFTNYFVYDNEFFADQPLRVLLTHDDVELSPCNLSKLGLLHASMPRKKRLSTDGMKVCLRLLEADQDGGETISRRGSSKATASPSKPQRFG